MSEATLVLTEAVATVLAGLARLEVEQAAVLLVGVHRTADGRLRLLARELHPIDDDACDRWPDGLIVQSRGWVQAVARGEVIGSAALWLHTHPGGNPSPSRRDAHVDEELGEPFRVRSGSSVYGSIIISPTSNPAGFSFTGRVVDSLDSFQVQTVLILGQRLRLLTAQDMPQATPNAVYDRQVRAFGGDVQAILAHLRVGVAGAGGTGSAVVEQLARLGVGSFTLFDDDELSGSNTTRVYGSSPEDVGLPKVQVLASHVLRISPGCQATAIVGKITEETHARLLSDCDVVFGCTDDEAGRMVLSRLAAFQLIPVFDCGVLIDSADGQIRGIHSRVTTLLPGSACLLCRGRVDPARAAAELMSADQHAALVREGYAPELPGVEPAVVAYTTLTAALAVGELIERLVGFGREPSPTELLTRIHEREMGSNSRLPRPGHYCDPAAAMLGSGDVLPFLGQAWAV